jgi:hypothetical protein
MGIRLNWGAAIFAGVLATSVMVLTMALFGINILKAVGVIANQEGSLAYVYGSLIVLAVGLFYAFCYAIIIRPVMRKFPKWMTGLFFGGIVYLISFSFTNPAIALFQEMFQKKIPLGFRGQKELYLKMRLKKASYYYKDFGEKSEGWTIDLANHCIYALVLAYLYQEKKGDNRS